MTRDQLIEQTRRLIAEGDRLQAAPSMGALRLWLSLSDDLLSVAWGSMDRYHLIWLGVGKPKAVVRGRPMTSDEEAAYVRDVAAQKTAVLRASLDAVQRQGMPFVGEHGGVARGQGMGRVPSPASLATPGAALERELDAARRTADDHRTGHEPRAPRPERMLK